MEFYAGIDDEVDVPGVVRGSSQVQAWTDGEPVGHIGVITGDQPAQKVAYFDHTAFADAKITCEE